MGYINQKPEATDFSYGYMENGDGAVVRVSKSSVLDALGITDLESNITDHVFNISYDGTGIHNSIYRGKYLGTAITDEQWAAIKAGTFDDLYIGDYWTINGVNWRIAAFDYYYKCGDTSCTTHHIVIVPDTSLYTAQMNSSNTTTGGYAGSEMYTANLETAKETIAAAFGSAHILSKRVYLTNAVTSGYPSAGAWYGSTVDLMNEEMVYGCPIRQQMPYGGTNVYTYTCEKSQLPLFAFRHDLIGIRTEWWLRDIVTAATFADVSSYGIASSISASYTRCVRPAFCIYQS